MGIIVETLKIAAIGYISQKGMRCFGKIDYADIIAFFTWCSVGGNIVRIIYNIASSDFMQTIAGAIVWVQKLFN